RCCLGSAHRWPSMQGVAAPAVVVERRVIYNFSDPLVQLSELERFRQKRDSGDSVISQRLYGPPDKQRFEPRPTSPRSIYHGRSAHFRHSVIYEQQVDRPLSSEDLQGKRGIVRFPDRVADVAQK